MVHPVVFTSVGEALEYIVKRYECADPYVFSFKNDQIMALTMQSDLSEIRRMLGDAWCKSLPDYDLLKKMFNLTVELNKKGGGMGRPPVSVAGDDIVRRMKTVLGYFSFKAFSERFKRYISEREKFNEAQKKEHPMPSFTPRIFDPKTPKIPEPAMDEPATPEPKTPEPIMTVPSSPVKSSITRSEVVVPETTPLFAKQFATLVKPSDVKKIWQEGKAEIERLNSSASSVDSDDDEEVCVVKRTKEPMIVVKDLHCVEEQEDLKAYSALLAKTSKKKGAEVQPVSSKPASKEKGGKKELKRYIQKHSWKVADGAVIAALRTVAELLLKAAEDMEDDKE